MTLAPLSFDRTAVNLVRVAVARLADDDLKLATPCEGWRIADLVLHMNAEHAAICGADPTLEGDPRRDFERVAAHWFGFFATAGPSVYVAKMASWIPADVVLETHAADMLVHLWDLTAALGRPCPVPDDYLRRALRAAELVTAPGSPLVGPSPAAYRPALPAIAGAPVMDALLRRFGRDPSWRPVV